MIVDRGGDRILQPLGIRLLDHHGSRSEAAQDDEHPEEPGQLVRGGDVGQAVDGGGLEKLLYSSHADGPLETEITTQCTFIQTALSKINHTFQSFKVVFLNTHSVDVEKFALQKARKPLN